MGLQRETGGKTFRVPHVHLPALHCFTCYYSKTLIPLHQTCFELLLKTGHCAVSLGPPKSLFYGYQ